MTTRHPRPTCYRCRRAAHLCACALLRPVPITFELAILMHPKEARVAIGTGRLVHRMIPGSHIIIAERLDDDPRLAHLLARPDLSPHLLFPLPGAIDLERDPGHPDLAPLISHPACTRRPLVLVPDGTWTTARKLVRLSDRLRALPALALVPPRPSRYGRLRKEPRPTCVSTLEAVHHLIDRLAALGLAAPPPARAHDHMLSVMDELVARQLAFEPAPPVRNRPRDAASTP